MKLPFARFKEIRQNPPDPAGFDNCCELHLKDWTDLWVIRRITPYSLQIVRGLLPIGGSRNEPKDIGFGFVGSLTEWVLSSSCWEAAAFLGLESMIWFPRVQMLYYTRDCHVTIFYNEKCVETLQARFTPCVTRPDISGLLSNMDFVKDREAFPGNFPQVVRSYSKSEIDNPFKPGKAFEMVYSQIPWQERDPSHFRFILPPRDLRAFNAVLDYLLGKFLKKGSWIMFKYPLLSPDNASMGLDIYLQQIGASNSLFEWPYLQSCSDDNRALGLAYRYGAMCMLEAFLYCPEAGFTCLFHHDEAIVFVALDSKMLESVYADVQAIVERRS